MWEAEDLEAATGQTVHDDRENGSPRRDTEPPFARPRFADATLVPLVPQSERNTAGGTRARPLQYSAAFEPQGSGFTATSYRRSVFMWLARMLFAVVTIAVVCAIVAVAVQLHDVESLMQHFKLEPCSLDPELGTTEGSNHECVHRWISGLFNLLEHLSNEVPDMIALFCNLFLLCAIAIGLLMFRFYFNRFHSVFRNGLRAIMNRQGD